MQTDLTTISGETHLIFGIRKIGRMEDEKGEKTPSAVAVLGFITILGLLAVSVYGAVSCGRVVLDGAVQPNLRIIAVRGISRSRLSVSAYTLHRWKLRFLRAKKWNMIFAYGRREQLSG